MTEEEWRTCDDPLAMLKSLDHRGSGRKYRLFAVACNRDLLEHAQNLGEDSLHPVYGWEAAILAAETLADGGEVRERNSYGWNVALRVCDEISDESVAYSVFGYDPDSGNWTGRPEEIVPERIRQYHIHPARYLRDIFGNPFRPIAFEAEWRTDTAVILARQMYDAREFSAMPILADALQDAGCDKDDLLNHLREPGTHVRGCWALDLVLGKE